MEVLAKALQVVVELIFKSLDLFLDRLNDEAVGKETTAAPINHKLGQTFKRFPSLHKIGGSS